MSRFTTTERIERARQGANRPTKGFRAVTDRVVNEAARFLQILWADNRLLAVDATGTATGDDLPHRPRHARRPRTRGGQYDTGLPGLHRDLGGRGFEEGRQINPLADDTKGDPKRARAAAAKFERDGVASISFRMSPTFAIKQATRSAPILSGRGPDPVAGGLADSTAKPGSRVSGVHHLVMGPTGKRLELFRRIVPPLQRVVTLYNSTNPPAQQGTVAERDAARVPRIHLIERYYPRPTLTTNLKTARALSLEVPVTLLTARGRGDEMSVRAARDRSKHRTTLRRSLFTKYFLSFVGLVSLVLLVNGAVNSWLAYRQAREAAVQVQAEKAEAAAQRIDQFIAEIERQIGWTTQAQWAASAVEQRRFDYVRLLRQVPAITEVVQLDASGREQLKVSRVAMDVVAAGTDYSNEARFKEARANRIWFSPVYFRKESEPYLTIAVAHTGRNGGVTFAELNLKLIWDVISTIKIGQGGYAYVVDQQGRLIAHPDISLVLRNTDLSRLPQVAAALAPASNGTARGLASEAADPAGHAMLSAHAPIQRLGWLVFVDLPLGEALAPLYATFAQTASLLLSGLGLSAVAGLLLTRRMVIPIRRLHEGALRLGRGDLSHRMDVRTGDELEHLAEGFNNMAEQIEESHRMLETKVDERTRELSEALAYQTATGDVLKAISRSTARTAACP